jgi:methylphosphotriester-DNA--protein-cysteine methyltransferase
MSSAEYHEYKPRTDLAGIINCLWTFDGDDAMADQAVVPDGRCELVVHCAEPYSECLRGSAVAVRQSSILFAGQVTQPLTLRATGPVSVVAVRFNTCGAWAFLGTSLLAYTDQRVELAKLFGEAALDLQSRIKTAAREHRVDIAQQFVAHRIGVASAMHEPVVERCVSLIYENKFAAIEYVRQKAGLSARTLQRKFSTVVGVPPRTLAAIVRFRRVFEALQQSSAVNWTEAAHAAGYYDLPQLDRDFRRFAGLPPSAFLAAGPGLARSLVNL